MQRPRAKDTPVEETFFAQRFGTIEFLRRLRDDQLSVIVPELFDRNMVAFNHLFLHGFLINKPEYIEHVLLTNQANYTKSHFLRRKDKLIKIGAKVVSYGRYVAFQMAEVAIPRQNVPGDFAAHRGTSAAATTSASVRRVTVMLRWEECVRMTAKMAASGPRTDA